jgi:hypothetical protein
MRIKTLILIVLLYSISLQAQVRTARNLVPADAPRPFSETDPGAKLPIRKVILYSNGVAYIERRGMVSGNAEINLSFKQSQVDDVLKSMLVLDMGQGRIGAVSYNSSLPASARTAEIPFSVFSSSANGGGISQVLAQLQGAKVIVTSTKGTATGAILTVEQRNVPGTRDIPGGITHFLVIASESGEISNFDLADVRSVKLLDDGTRRDVNEFANATASTRRRDAKTITVTSEGAGQREMIVSYTIAAPIWKTTYRVVLDEQGKPFFQGWAIIDNVSEEDWKNVQLSLISGTPISFIQPIQKPLYRYRPVVPIPQDLNLQPQVYDEHGNTTQVGQSEAGGTTVDVTANRVQTSVTQQSLQNLPSNARSVQNFSVQGATGGQNTYVVDGAAGTSVSSALTSGNSGVQANATGEEIGDLFEYRIDQLVTVMRDRSALIPIVQTKMDGERVSIFNESTRQQRPMSGMLLKNLTALTFENGSLTVIDHDAYAGEALMERLKPKEQRLISFALDLGTLVTVDAREDREPAKIVKVVNGVLQVHYFRSDKKVYKVTNQTDRKKVLYIEHPVRTDWTLSETASAKPDYTTARYYRFRVELEPFGKQDITVAENQGLMDTYSLSQISSADLSLFVSRRYIDESTRVKMAKLIDLRMRINQIDNKLGTFDDEIEKIEEDQKRLRENIETLSKTPEARTLITRYITKANDQETRLEQIEKERTALEAQKDQLENELGTEIMNFQIVQ